MDPASGTLLALAICHEREGKLASAWGEYLDVASRSKLEGRPDRETAARSKGAELEPKVSTLTIVVADSVAVTGLEIRRNGIVMAPAWFGTAVPVDGGVEIIDALAPGRKARHVEIVIAPSGDRQTLTLAPLESVGARAPHEPARTTADTPAATITIAPAEPVPIAAVADASTPPQGPIPVQGAEAPRSGLGALRLTGAIAAAAGVASLGVSAFFAVQAVNKNDASHDQCDGDLCTSLGKQDRSDALSAGNIATAALIGGGALVAAGAALYFFAPRDHQEKATSARTGVIAYPSADDHGVGAILRGTF